MTCNVIGSSFFWTMVDAPRRVLTGHIGGGEIDGLNLRAVSARDYARARERMNGFRSPVPVVVAGELAERADIVLECAPAAMFREIAKPVEDAGGFKRRQRYFEEWWMETHGVPVCRCKRRKQAVMMNEEPPRIGTPLLSGAA